MWLVIESVVILDADMTIPFVYVCGCVSRNHENYTYEIMCSESVFAIATLAGLAIDPLPGHFMCFNGFANIKSHLHICDARLAYPRSAQLIFGIEPFFHSNENRFTSERNGKKMPDIFQYEIWFCAIFSVSRSFISSLYRAWSILFFFNFPHDNVRAAASKCTYISRTSIHERIEKSIKISRFFCCRSFFYSFSALFPLNVLQLMWARVCVS